MRTLILLAKYPEVGQVKTRLAGQIGAVAATRFYEASLRTTLARFRASGDQRIVAVSPDERAHAMQSLANQDWCCEPQGAGDLGDRIKSAAQRHWRAGDQIVVIGADSPTMPLARLESAWECLRSTPVALGPAEDGGYYLLGVANQPEGLPIFEGIDWGTNQVLSQTIARLVASATPFQLLAPWYDLDDQDALFRLRGELCSESIDNHDWDVLRQALP